MTRRRLDIKEAAAALGTSVDAVRKRIQRGTLESERQDGKVYVWLGGDRMIESETLTSAKDETITELRARVASLEHQLQLRAEEIQRRDVIISQFAQLIPELPPTEREEEPPEPHDSADSSPEGEEAQTKQESSRSSSQHPQEQKRSWWRRMFGG